MSEGAKDNAPKVIKGQLPRAQREWIVERLSEGLSVRYITEQLLADYPEYLEHAESNGFTKRELYVRMRERIHDFRDSRRPNSQAIRDRNANARFVVLNPDNLPKLLDRNLSDADLTELSEIVLDAVLGFEPNADQAANLKEIKALIGVRSGLDNLFIKRLETRVKLAEKIYLKHFSSQAEGDDTNQVQAKPTLAFGEYDWDDDSWLEGSDEESNEPEE